MNMLEEEKETCEMPSRDEVSIDKGEQTDDKIEEVGNGIKMEEQRTEQERLSHRPSNLKRRWKRRPFTVSAATIHEDDEKQPKEIDAVEIPTAETLNYAERSVKEFHKKPTKYKRCNSYCEGSEKEREGKSRRCHCQFDRKLRHGTKKCDCKSTLRSKIKRLFMKLFAIPSAKDKKVSEKNGKSKLQRSYSHRRSHRPYVRTHDE